MRDETLHSVGPGPGTPVVAETNGEFCGGEINAGSICGGKCQTSLKFQVTEPLGSNAQVSCFAVFAVSSELAGSLL